MSQRDAWTELNELRRQTGKAKMRTQSDHAKDLHPLTAYTHMFDPMGPLTVMIARAEALKMWFMLAKDPEIRAFAEMVADHHIAHLEKHQSRWQGQDMIYYDDDQTPGRRIIFEKGDGVLLGGLDDLPSG